MVWRCFLADPRLSFHDRFRLNFSNYSIQRHSSLYSRSESTRISLRGNSLRFAHLSSVCGRGRQLSQVTLALVPVRNALILPIQGLLSPLTPRGAGRDSLLVCRKASPSGKGWKNLDKKKQRGRPRQAAKVSHRCGN